jgi:hypothetical protein
MVGWRKSPELLGLVALVVALALVPGPARGAVAKPAPAAGPARVVPKATAKHPSKASGTALLPDSVLARIGTHRRITISDFRRAWNQLEPPSRPDSLTPGTARGFLDLLIGKEVLGEVALSQPWHWSPKESVQTVAMVDRMVMRAELDSALRVTRAERAALGDTVRSLDVLGTVARDSLVARLGAVFDDSLAARLARTWAAIPRPSRDSSIMAQIRVLGIMPRVPPADTALVLARTSEGNFLVRELIAAWARIDPLTRPRISTASQIEDLARNGIFERHLRRDAARRRIEQWPEVKAALAKQMEYLAVTHLVAREVYATLVPDSIALHRFYRDHIDDFGLPARASIIRLDLPSQGEAARMAHELQDPIQAETLVVRAQRRGVEYRAVVAEESDSVVFRRAWRAGAGTVLGPDSTAHGWEVVRVEEVLPARRRSYEEVPAMVEHSWYEDEGELRMQALVDRERRRARVVINPVALRRLTEPGHRPDLP